MPANYYLSKPILQIAGSNAPPELLKDILQISVEESLHLPGMFTLVIHNTYDSVNQQDQPWGNEKYFKIGDPLKIGFATSTTMAREFNKEEQESHLIDGEITALEVHFTDKSEAHIIVRGYDVSHRLHRGRYNRSFLNQTDSDIVRKIASEVGMQPGQVDDSGQPHDYVFQENQTNMEFLRERGARIGFELFVQDNKLNFRKPKKSASLNLQWLVDITSFSTRVTSAEQVSSVEVRSWDYRKKQLISETAQSQSAQLLTNTGNGKGSSTSTDFNLSNQPPKMTVVDQPVLGSHNVFTKEEAKTMAQSLFDELGGEFVYADAKAEGNPEIRPGRVIKLQGMGDRFSGDYYVTETRHFYSERNYKTEFSVRGLRSGNLLTTLSPQVRLQPGQTLMVGIVTNIQDPESLGRVKVKIPTLSEQDESNWARVVGLGAANKRGFYCLPEVNDEVLVGFEHGDIHRPYIIGGVWNGKDATVETVNDTIQGGQVRLRTIKTRTGHYIQFVEEDGRNGQTGVYVKTAGGHQLSLNDSNRSVEVKTTAGQHLTLNDEGMTVTLQTEGVINIQAGGDVSVQAGGAVNIEAGGEASVQAGGAVSIDAGGEVNLAAAGAVTIEAVADINLAAAAAVTIEAVGDINLTAVSISTEGLLTNNGMPVMVLPVG